MPWRELQTSATTLPPASTGISARSDCSCILSLLSSRLAARYHHILPASQPASQGQQPHACSPRTTRPGRWAERQAIFTWAGHLQVVNNGVGVGQCARREHDEPWRSVWTVEAGRQAFQQSKLPIDRRPVACPHRAHGNGVRVIPLSPPRLCNASLQRPRCECDDACMALKDHGRTSSRSTHIGVVRIDTLLLSRRRISFLHSASVPNQHIVHSTTPFRPSPLLSTLPSFSLRFPPPSFHHFPAGSSFASSARLSEDSSLYASRLLSLRRAAPRRRDLS